jgi:hypothetical protein
VILVTCAAGPHLLFIAQCDGSSPATNGLERPRSERVRQEAHRTRWGPSGSLGDQSNKYRQQSFMHERVM